MKIYKITLKTLANNGKINSFKTSGQHRRFRQDDLDAYMGVEKEKQEKLTVIYARCSTAKQKENLERQKDRLRKHAEAKSWHLSAATYRLLGDKVGYVRQRGFEPLQQQQMVLQYVEKHGRITRHEVAELCRIGPYQASRLLGRLTIEGRLLRHGERKGAWYERGQKI